MQEVVTIRVAVGVCITLEPVYSSRIHSAYAANA
jgi:hypothetical protein